MTKDQKIIRAKVGLLELDKQLGNVSQDCKMMRYSRQLLPLQGALRNRRRTGAAGTSPDNESVPAQQVACPAPRSTSSLFHSGALRLARFQMRKARGGKRWLVSLNAS